MAKKTRKARKISAPTIAQPAGGEQAGGMTAAAPAGVTHARSTYMPPARTLTMAQAAVTFRQEYKYVLSDLRRTAILAAVLFVAMIVLALIRIW